MAADGCGKKFAWGNAMVRSGHARAVGNLGIAAALTMFLGACGSFSLPSFSSSPAVAPEPPAVPEMPATIRADEIVGRWGLASFQNPNDRVRTEAAARAQCKQPYVIGAGTSGGVVMHLADQATPQELRLKGSPSGKNYIGPQGPAGGEQDREIVSFDGRVLVTRFIDKDAATRYGNMVYVRCAPRA
ncbi:MAG: hypothetical protein QOF22_704 [Bradyrhizobium sp.]|nr:hypothetical protein [Bradyrhizobium sp.]